MNHERFLNDVANWLKQDLTDSLLDYVFNPTDGPFCREKYVETEQFYLDNKD